MRGFGAAPQPTQDDATYKARNSFVYETFIPAALNSGQSTSSSFNIDGDSDFFWTKLNAFALVADDGTTYSAQQLPGVSVVITNTTSGRQYMNAPVPLPNIAGTAQLPFILPMVTYFPAKATIQITYQNNTDNTNYSLLHLSFIGIKAFT